MRDGIAFKRLAERWAELMEQNRERLIELDSVVGDGDLGLTMSDGFRAAFRAVEDSPETDVGRLSYAAGKAMAAAVPSTMGTLMASGLMQAGKALVGKTELRGADLALYFREYVQGVRQRGKAGFGEKTFLDGWPAALELLEEHAGAQDADLPGLLARVSAAAHRDFLATSGMLPLHGRAAARGEAARPIADPGAAVAALMMQGLYEVTTNREE